MKINALSDLKQVKKAIEAQAAREAALAAHKAAEAKREHQHHQRKHHDRPERVMTEMEVGFSAADGRQVGAQARGRGEEARKARVLAADETPHDAGDDQPAGEIADPLMKHLAVLDHKGAGGDIAPDRGETRHHGRCRKGSVNLLQPFLNLCDGLLLQEQGRGAGAVPIRTAT